MANVNPLLKAGIDRAVSVSTDPQSLISNLKSQFRGSTIPFTLDDTTYAFNLLNQKLQNGTNLQSSTSGDGGETGKPANGFEAIKNVVEGAIKSQESQPYFTQLSEEMVGVTDLFDILLNSQGKFNDLSKIGATLVNAVAKGAEDYYKNQTALLETVNQEIGLTGELSKDFREEITNARPELVRLNISWDDTVNSLKTIISETGKYNLLNQQTIEKVALIGKAYLGSMAELAKLVPDFEKIGLGALDTAKQVERSSRSSISLGLSSRTTISDIKTNIAKINEYGFKNGLDGLTRMSQKAVEFRMSMNDAFTVADKVLQPDSALELSANLQVLGGAIGDFNDPLKLMYMATNNVEGLQDSLIEASKSLATYNSEQGRFEITGVNIRRAKEMAAQLGIEYKNLAQGAIAAQERMSAAADLSGLNIEEKDKEFITNLATMQDGRMVIQLQGEEMKKAFGAVDSGIVELQSLTAEQSKLLTDKYRDDFVKKDAFEIARDQATNIQNIKNDLSYIVAYAKVTAGRGIDRAAVSVMKELELDPKKVTEELYNFTKTELPKMGQGFTELFNKSENKTGKETKATNTPEKSTQNKRTPPNPKESNTPKSKTPEQKTTEPEKKTQQTPQTQVQTPEISSTTTINTDLAIQKIYPNGFKKVDDENLDQNASLASANLKSEDLSNNIKSSNNQLLQGLTEYNTDLNKGIGDVNINLTKIYDALKTQTNVRLGGTQETGLTKIEIPKSTNSTDNNENVNNQFRNAANNLTQNNNGQQPLINNQTTNYTSTQNTVASNNVPSVPQTTESIVNQLGLANSSAIKDFIEEYKGIVSSSNQSLNDFVGKSINLIGDKKPEELNQLIPLFEKLGVNVTELKSLYASIQDEKQTPVTSTEIGKQNIQPKSKENETETSPKPQEIASTTKKGDENRDESVTYQQLLMSFVDKMNKLVLSPDVATTKSPTSQPVNVNIGREGLAVAKPTEPTIPNILLNSQEKSTEQQTDGFESIRQGLAALTTKMDKIGGTPNIINPNITIPSEQKPVNVNIDRESLSFLKPTEPTILNGLQLNQQKPIEQTDGFESIRDGFAVLTEQIKGISPSPNVNKTTIGGTLPQESVVAKTTSPLNLDLSNIQEMLGNQVSLIGDTLDRKIGDYSVAKSPYNLPTNQSTQNFETNRFDNILRNITESTETSFTRIYEETIKPISLSYGKTDTNNLLTSINKFSDVVNNTNVEKNTDNVNEINNQTNSYFTKINEETIKSFEQRIGESDFGNSIGKLNENIGKLPNIGNVESAIKPSIGGTQDFAGGETELKSPTTNYTTLNTLNQQQVNGLTDLGITSINESLTSFNQTSSLMFENLERKLSELNINNTQSTIYQTTNETPIINRDVTANNQPPIAEETIGLLQKSYDLTPVTDALVNGFKSITPQGVNVQNDVTAKVEPQTPIEQKLIFAPPTSTTDLATKIQDQSITKTQNESKKESETETKRKIEIVHRIEGVDALTRGFETYIYKNASSIMEAAETDPRSYV